MACVVSRGNRENTMGKSGGACSLHDSGASLCLSDAFKQFRERKLEEKKRLHELKTKANEKKRTEAFKGHLRKKFVEAARQYLGVPYGKRFHEQDPAKACKCEGCLESGKQIRDEPMFLDCCALVRKCVHDLREDFGFVLGAGNQAYQFDTLPIRVDSVDQLEPGDLIFFSGEYFSDKCKQQKHDMVHVEIFVGGDSGKAVIGSREKQKWIKEYDTYEFVSKSWKLKEYFFVKIDTWLDGQLKNHCKTCDWSRFLNKKNSHKNSLFFVEETAEQ